MHAPDAVRILMYSHDTYGLGHLTRTVRIARAIRNRSPRASILILSGSPVAPYVALPPGADLVKLPSVLKAGAERYQSRNLAVGFSQIKKMRRNVIRSTADTFRPHFFLVDNVPTGMKGEILPTLELIRRKFPRTRTILNLRDILDDQEVIRHAWERDGVPEVIRTYYDQIYVLGDPGVFDATAAYNLPSDRTLLVGYATPSPTRIADKHGPSSKVSARPRVLLTAGGGGDGFELLSIAMEGLTHLSRRIHSRDPKKSLDIEVVTGPLMEFENRRRLGEMAERNGAHLEEFVPDLPRRMAQADLVIAMAGYNTSCDILSHGHAAVFHPRIAPRAEQLIRTQAFEKRGLVSMISQEKLDPESLAGVTGTALQEGPRIDDGELPALGGLERLAEHFVSMFSIAENGSHMNGARARRTKAERKVSSGPGGSGSPHPDGVDRRPHTYSKFASQFAIPYWPGRAASQRQEP
jgi:predicted glycosyltransferase